MAYRKPVIFIDIPELSHLLRHFDDLELKVFFFVFFGRVFGGLRKFYSLYESRAPTSRNAVLDIAYFHFSVCYCMCLRCDRLCGYYRVATSSMRPVCPDGFCTHLIHAQ